MDSCKVDEHHFESNVLDVAMLRGRVVNCPGNQVVRFAFPLGPILSILAEAVGDDMLDHFCSLFAPSVNRNEELVYDTG